MILMKIKHAPARRSRLIILFSTGMTTRLFEKDMSSQLFFFSFLFFYHIVINEEFETRDAPACSFLRHCKVLIVLLRAIFDSL